MDGDASPPAELSRQWRSLFHPHDPAAFLSAVREHRRLVLRTDQAKRLAALLPWSLVNQLIDLEDLVGGRTRMVRQGRPVPLEMVSAIPRPATRRMLFPDALQSLARLGVSLVFNGVDEQAPQIAALTAMIERRLRCRTFANAYASFGRDSAFGAHFDAQNVLIVQLQGKKRWWCHGAVEPWPLASRSIPQAELGPVQWEGLLEPGDLLFVPRGDVHRAEVEGEASLHLTITMTPPTGQDVAEWIGRQAAAAVPVMRQDLPAVDDGTALSARAETLRAALRRQVDLLDMSAFLADADLRRPAVRPFTLGLDADLRPHTPLAPMLRRRIALPRAEAGEVSLAVEDSTFRLTSSERDVLAALLEADAMTIAELQALLPDHDVAVAAAGLVRKTLALPLAE